MGMLQRFENRLERLVSEAFARAFRSAVQPVEVAAALRREVDNSAQILSSDRRLVPNQFHVELSPADHERLAPYSSTLADELVEMLRDHAHEQSYVFTGPVTISFDEKDDLSTGRFRVRSAALAQVTPGRQRRSPTRRYAAPGGARGQRHEAPAGPPGIVIGRGAEADLRMPDPGCRAGAEIRIYPGDTAVPQVSVVDLGSTNGMLVNGQRVQQATLDDGAEVEIGEHHHDHPPHRRRRPPREAARVSELTLMLIRFAYLAILWIFDALRHLRGAFGHVRRTGRAGPRADRRPSASPARKAAKAKPTKRPRGAPTHVAVTDGANAGETVSLDLAPILIGRGADAAIRLDDDYVSTGTPGSPARATSGSSRTWARPTAPTSGRRG